MRLIPNPLTLAILAFAIAFSPSLQAADYTFGVQFGLSLPTGDLKTLVDSNVGGELGVHMLVDFSGGYVLRPWLDLSAFNGDSKIRSVNGIDGPTTTQKASMGALGADFLYFLNGNSVKSPYVLAGAGYSNNELKREHVSGASTVTISGSTTKPYFTVGGGYQFNRRWGVEGRYTSTRWTDTKGIAGGKSANLNVWTATGTFRF